MENRGDWTEAPTLRLVDDLSVEYFTALIDEIMGAYQANASHDYFDLVGMWVGGGPL
jgi:hypothetical protein